MIAVVDYGMGNIRSVEKAFQKIGADVEITSDPHSIANAQGIVLPGVGAFRDCMRNLERLAIVDTVIKDIQGGKPYLGICLGMQILFEESEEFGICRGMGVFCGRVIKFRFPATMSPANDDAQALKIPHMGWNTVKYVRRPPLFEDIPDRSFFYFVHSYYVSPSEDTVVAGQTEYGIDFVSMVWKDNIIATQFHPEKSQQPGLKIVKGFVNFVKKYA